MEILFFIQTKSLVNKVYYSNTINVGVPCAQVKDNIFGRENVYIIGH